MKTQTVPGVRGCGGVRVAAPTHPSENTTITRFPRSVKSKGKKWEGCVEIEGWI